MAVKLSIEPLPNSVDGEIHWRALSWTVVERWSDGLPQVLCIRLTRDLTGEVCLKVFEKSDVELHGLDLCRTVAVLFAEIMWGETNPPPRQQPWGNSACALLTNGGSDVLDTPPSGELGGALAVSDKYALASTAHANMMAVPDRTRCEMVVIKRRAKPPMALTADDAYHLYGILDAFFADGRCVQNENGSWTVGIRRE